MSDSATVVGKAIAARARRELMEGGPGSFLRVQQLQDAEILAFCDDLDGFCFGGCAEPVKVVVGVRDNDLLGLPKKFRLPPDATLTSYRNEHDLSLVVVERDPLSDAQSLGRLKTITDRSILAEGEDARKDLVRVAWEAAEQQTSRQPAALARMINEVLDQVEQQESVAIRKSVEFCLECCSQLASSIGAVDDPTVGRAVGSALPALGLFRDVNIFDSSNAVKRLQKLRRNVLFAHDQDARERPIDPDEVSRVLGRIEFLDESGSAYPEDEQTTIRTKILRRLYPIPGKRPPPLDLFIWEQLFAETERRRGLGTRIRDHLEDSDEDRLEEYDGLDVCEGLDSRRQEPARLLLATEESEGDEPALISILPTRLRRAVERLAEPVAPAVHDPLLHLLQQLHQLIQEGGESEGVQVIHLEHSVSTRRDDRKSLALFAFLYGSTITDAFAGSESALRLQMMVDSGLTTIGPVQDEVDPERDESESEPTDGWDPLEVSLRWDGEKTPLHRFRWAPLDHLGLVAFRELIGLEQNARWDIEGDRFDDWCRPALEGRLRGGHSIEPPIAGGPVARWLERRSEALSELQGGLCWNTLDAYVNDWEHLLREVARDHVPQAAPLPETSAFLLVDTLESVPEHRTILATHPIRLRWWARHLRGCRELLGAVCDDELRINSVNEGLYFDLLTQLSPHEQPPIITVGGDMFVAVREQDGHEHFAKLRDRSASYHDWLSDLDDSSIDELAAAVSEYVDAHPHKRDGISLLFLVREGGSRVVGHLLSKVLKHEGRRVGAVVYVVAPSSEFLELEQTLAAFDDPEERANSDFPPLEVVLHRWPDDAQLPSLDDLGVEVDIAVVPNLFGAATNPIDSSRPTGNEPGRFDPWSDATSYLASSSTDLTLGVPNVSRILLPDRPDQMLRDWSTINVRQQRGTPVSDDQESVDYVTMQVHFHQGASMYEQLHVRAHWVVTLDAFIGREQIESLESRPDVILMRPRVGKNRAHNLVVSSKTGRHFIENRIKARLEADLSQELHLDLVELPAILYDRGRELFPGLVLRCLGVGWAVQELVGLVITHRLVEERRPTEPVEGFVAWLSLDEQHKWFGSARNRADLARITARHVDDRLLVEVLVVESKFRLEENVSVADRQVRTSLDLLRDALAPNTGEGGFADGRFWRTQILDAAEQSSRRGEGDGGRAALRAWERDGTPTPTITPAVKAQWLDGEFELHKTEGVICTMSAALDAKLAGEQVSPGGFAWYRLGAAEIARALRVLGEPLQETGPVAVPDVLPDEEPEPITGRVDTIYDTVDDEPDTNVVQPLGGDASSDGRHTVEEMESLYQIVLDVFGEYGVRVERPAEEAYREGPGFYVFRVMPSAGVKPEAMIRLTNELKLKLGLEKDFKPLSYIDMGTVVFEVPKRDDDRYFVDADRMWKQSKFSEDCLYAPIGEDIRGDIVGIDFSSSDSPHLLIAGLTGSGKSIALETILLGLCRSHPPARLRLALIDPKGTELNEFEDDDHLLGVIGYDPEDAIELLDSAVEEMQRRRQAFRSVKARALPEYNSKVPPQDVLPWWVLVLDEYADLTSDKEDRKRIEQSLQRLSQKARASGIHVIVATQKPAAEVISTTVRSNLPAQLALRVKTATDSRIVMDEGGAEALAGKGDALFKTARRTVRVQCAALVR